MANNIEGIYMPELIIYEFLKVVLKITKDDYNEATDKNETMLAYLFKNDRIEKPLELETFNYYEQAVRIIVQNNIQVNLGYNTETAEMNCIHILLPSESGEPIGVGGDEGYREEVQTETDKKEVFTQKFNTTYNLLLSSVNALELIVIYNFIKACFVSLHYHLELYGFQNLKLSGNDIQMQPDLVPTNIFHRSITLSFGYEMSIPNFYKSKLAKKFKLTGIILPLNEQI